MTLRLPDDEARALQKHAELEDRPMQTVVRQALREYIEAHKPCRSTGHGAR